jgi:hypothetical protein
MWCIKVSSKSQCEGMGCWGRVCLLMVPSVIKTDMHAVLVVKVMLSQKYISVSFRNSHM